MSPTYVQGLSLRDTQRDQEKEDDEIQTRSGSYIHGTQQPLPRTLVLQYNGGYALRERRAPLSSREAAKARADFMPPPPLSTNTRERERGRGTKAGPQFVFAVAADDYYVLLYGLEHRAVYTCRARRRVVVVVPKRFLARA